MLAAFFFPPLFSDNVLHSSMVKASDYIQKRGAAQDFLDINVFWSNMKPAHIEYIILSQIWCKNKTQNKILKAFSTSGSQQHLCRCRNLPLVWIQGRVSFSYNVSGLSRRYPTTQTWINKWMDCSTEKTKMPQELMGITSPQTCKVRDCCIQTGNPRAAPVCMLHCCRNMKAESLLVLTLASLRRFTNLHKQTTSHHASVGLVV